MTIPATNITCLKHPDAGQLQDTYKGDRVIRCADCEGILVRRITTHLDE